MNGPPDRWDVLAYDPNQANNLPDARRQRRISEDDDIGDAKCAHSIPLYLFLGYFTVEVILNMDKL